jgi:hypothetical protein
LFHFFSAGKRLRAAERGQRKRDGSARANCEASQLIHNRLFAENANVVKPIR